MRHLTIPIPLVGTVSIEPIGALLAQPALTRLGQLRQLGGAWIVFPGAVHTRLEHSLGVFARSQQRAHFWHERGWISRQDATDLALYGLVHDLGHNPYSHLTDPLCAVDHNERGQQQFAQLKGAVEDCDGDWEHIDHLFTNECDPLSQAVRNHPVGTDKQDYLERDAHHTAALDRPNVSRFLQHTYLHSGQLCVDISCNEALIHLREQYIHAYRNLYFHPDVMIVDRYLQKMLAELMFPRSGPPELTEVELLTLCDSDLDHRLATAKCAWVRTGFAELLARQLPRTIIVLCREDDIRLEEQRHPDALIVAVSDQTLHRLQLTSIQEILEVEHTLADAARISDHELLLIPCRDRRRLVLPDLPLIGSKDELVPLTELNRPHWEAMVAAARTFQTVQVCVTASRYDRLINEQRLRLIEILNPL